LVYLPITTAVETDSAISIISTPLSIRDTRTDVGHHKRSKRTYDWLEDWPYGHFAIS